MAELATNALKVRLRIGDTGADLFTDDEIDDFLSENDNDIYRAAVDALLTLGNEAVLHAKWVQTGRHIIDTRAAARNYRDMAEAMQKKASSQVAFGIAETANSSFTADEIIANDALR